MSFQNADTERDLAILRHLQLRTKGQLGDERVDERLRIRLQAEPALKQNSPCHGRCPGRMRALGKAAAPPRSSLCLEADLCARCSATARSDKAARWQEVSPTVAEQPVAVDPAPLRPEDVCGFLQA